MQKLLEELLVKSQKEYLEAPAGITERVLGGIPDRTFSGSNSKKNLRRNYGATHLEESQMQIPEESQERLL